MQKKQNSKKYRLITRSLVAGLSLFSAHSMALERTTFVHLFEWKWNAIAQECENVLGPKGYKAIQISPPNKTIENNIWWGRYQPVGYSFESSLGNRSELESMVQRCNAVGVEIYLDAVINHTAGNQEEYGDGDFHNAGSINNYNDRDEVQNGALLGLRDLNTGSQNVQQKIADYINDAQSMGITGFRIDAAKHIAASELEQIVAKFNGNPYVFQEVIGSWGEPIQPEEYLHIASVTEFNFERTIGNKFQDGGISQLKNMEASWLPSDKAVIFVDNHDDQRQHEYSTLTFKDGKALYQLGNIFMLAYPYGYPKLISGFKLYGSGKEELNNQPLPSDGGVHNGGNCDADGGEWICTHRWPAIANMVGFRNATNGEALANWWDNGDNQIAFGRGNKGFVVINRDESGLNETLPTGLPEGDYCDVISGDDCNVMISVDASGNASFNVGPMTAVAIYVGGAASSNPVIKISGAPKRVDLGESITLDGSESTDSDGSIVSYSWSTGETSPSITKTLDTEGEHSFTLTVTDNDNNSSSKTVSIYAGELPPQGNFAALNFRGTPNDWKTTAMKLVADNTWEATIEFNGEAKQRFKFDEGEDWTASWGDADADGKLDNSSDSNDIYTEVTGSYRVSVNDSTMVYHIEPVENEDEAPVAQITPSADSIKQGETINFSADGSTDDKGIQSYEWSNGETGEQISLQFNEIGTHTISVTVTDTTGQTDSASATITVTEITPIDPEDKAPIADLTPQHQSVVEGNSIQFSAAASNDDNGIVSYEWNTGQSGKTMTHQFNTVGTETISVTVTDAKGQSDTAETTITVTKKPIQVDTPPVAHINPSETSVKPGQKVTLSGIASSDNNGDVSYLWSTGETNAEIEVTFDEVGEHTVTLTVTDSAKQTDSTSINISVTDEQQNPPEDNNQQNQSQTTTSDGGSLSWFGLFSLLLIAIKRRQQ